MRLKRAGAITLLSFALIWLTGCGDQLNPTLPPAAKATPPPLISTQAISTSIRSATATTQATTKTTAGLATTANTKTADTSQSGNTSPNSNITSHGGPVKDYVSLIDSLRAAGTTVNPEGEIEQPFFSVKGYSITLNGGDVQVFEYADTKAAEAEAAKVSADGGSVGTTMLSWMGTPHFFKKEKLIVLYIGNDKAVLALLQTMLGSQFAGGK